MDIVGPEAAALLALVHERAFAAAVEQVWTAATFRDLLEMPGTSALILSDSGTPLGFLLVRRIGDEMEILTNCILPECRGQGRGRRLLGELCRRARRKNVAAIFLEVREANDAAITLYRKQGFREAGRRKNYYDGEEGDARDALVMTYVVSGDGKKKNQPLVIA